METHIYRCVFAQLIVGTQHVGVHAFVIQIRDETSTNVMPNLRILDCGPKAGLNGVRTETNTHSRAESDPDAIRSGSASIPHRRIMITFALVLFPCLGRQRSSLVGQLSRAKECAAEQVR